MRIKLFGYRITLTIDKAPKIEPEKLVDLFNKIVVPELESVKIDKERNIRNIGMVSPSPYVTTVKIPKDIERTSPPADTKAKAKTKSKSTGKSKAKVKAKTTNKLK
jgi:hypothetical protein